jgi:hypothetical protein
MRGRLAPLRSENRPRHSIVLGDFDKRSRRTCRGSGGHGKLAIKDGKYTDALAGKVIRHKHHE